MDGGGVSSCPVVVLGEELLIHTVLQTVGNTTWKIEKRKEIKCIVQCSTVHTGELVSVTALHFKAGGIFFFFTSLTHFLQRHRSWTRLNRSMVTTGGNHKKI